MAKQVTGEAVIYTDNGVAVVPAYVRRVFNIHSDANEISTFLKKGTRYIIIGGSKTSDDKNNPYSSVPMPQVVDRATKYAKTKFFRLIMDLMQCAQFDPLAGVNGTERAFLSNCFTELKNPREPIDSDINFDVSIPDIDSQFYRKYQFTDSMINFIEERYNYDG